MTTDQYIGIDVNFLITSGSSNWLGFEINGHSTVDEIPTGSIVFVNPNDPLYPECNVVLKREDRYSVARMTASDCRCLRLVSSDGVSVAGTPRCPNPLAEGEIIGVVSAHLVVYRMIEQRIRRRANIALPVILLLLAMLVAVGNVLCDVPAMLLD